jgi:predicted ATPase
MIKSLEVKNFKAIEKGKVKLTPLTAFIGYNGTGKSSMLEALETFQVIVTDGLEKSMSRWRKFEHIHYKGKKTQRTFESGGEKYLYAPMEFIFNATIEKKKTKFSSAIGQDLDEHIYFLEETVSYPQLPNNFIRVRTPDHKYITQGKEAMWLTPERSILSGEREIRKYVESWQFLAMNTFLMGNPYPQKKTGGQIILNHDGSNIAEYVLAIRNANPDVFRGIIETMQTILPYASDIQPVITEELEKLVYMQVTEQNFKVPGWLLSTGTLKVLALLAVFRNPNPSPLIVIEEIENGLDPRTINLIVKEIHALINDTASQVIVTTHSPYLLDLLHLSQVVFVEREKGKVVFKRPYDDDELRKWSKDYTPGELYEKDLLQQYLNK